MGTRQSSASVAQEYSNTVTAVFTPDGHDADQLRATSRLSISTFPLGAGWESLPGKVFRIVTWDIFNDLMLTGRLTESKWHAMASVPHETALA